MMSRLYLIGLSATLLSCTAITPSIMHQYQLTAYSTQSLSHTSSTIFVSVPEAVEDYQSADMQYTLNTYSLKSYSNNAWTAPPAKMLYPLIIESLQSSRYFKAVISGYWANTADYRLDTQLIEFKQDFTSHPSRFLFKAKVTLTQLVSNQVIVSKTLAYQPTCAQDTPIEGVMAANQATKAFTYDIIQLIGRYAKP